MAVPAKGRLCGECKGNAFVANQERAPLWHKRWESFYGNLYYGLLLCQYLLRTAFVSEMIRITFMS